MKAPLLCTALALVFGAAPVLAKSELEMLREENRALKAELAQLKGHPISTPVRKETVAAKPVVASRASTYTVVSGDSLERIARRSNCSVKALVKANQLKKTVIHPGQILKIPSAPQAPPSAALVNVPKSTAVAATKPGPAAEAPKAKAPAAASSQTVVSNVPKTQVVSNAVASSRPAASKDTPPETTVPVAAPRITGPILAKRSVIIDTQTTYGDFAARHQTTAEQLNDLNGFSLSPTTVLAKGSEIDVPAQP